MKRLKSLAMNKYIAILLLAFSGTVFAESYLCIPEAAAGISYNYKQLNNYQSHKFNEDQYKFLQTNESGKWIVKIYELGVAHYQNCESEYYCTPSEDTAGDFFLRGKDNQFQALFSAVTNLDTGSANMVLYLGTCSKI